MRAQPVAAAALVLAACQTGGGPREEVRLPAVLEPLFVNCAPADGASSLAVFADERLLGSADAEWRALANGDWDLELTNAVGQTVLTVSRRGAEISAAGPLAAKLPRLGVRPSGFLDVGGHLVGVKAAEVPCLLGFGFPRAWVAMADGIDADGRKTVVSFSDPVRDIALTARGLSGKRDEGACAALSWRKLLFLRHELTWCLAVSGRRSAELRGIEDYKLKWVKIDER